MTGSGIHKVYKQRTQKKIFGTRHFCRMSQDVGKLRCRIDTGSTVYIYIKKSNEIRMLVHIKEIINKKEQDNIVPEDLQQQ